MGLFNSIKRKLGVGGGIGATFSSPKAFVWEDEHLPLTVELSGHPSEARVITDISFQLTDNLHEHDREMSSSEQRRVNYHWEHSEVIQLDASEQRTLTLNMPLPFSSSEKQQLFEDGAVGDGILGKMLGSLTTGPPTDIPYYTITMRARIDGAKTRTNASRNIRYADAKTSRLTIGGLQIN